MSLTLLLQYAGDAVVFLTMISVLVAAHELGHYVFARWFGMGVEEFAIGFGKRPLVTWMRRNYRVAVGQGEEIDAPHRSAMLADSIASSFVKTVEGAGVPRAVVVVETPSGPVLEETTDFTIRPLPLGGFVRIKGMIPEDDGSETRIPGGFYSKAPWKRFLVLLAGPLFSVLAGIFVLVPALMVDGKEVPVNRPVIATVEPGMPAAQAGLKAGDRITAIDGTPISTFYQIVQVLQASHGRSLHVALDRGGHAKTVLLTPKLETEPSPVRGPDMEIIPDRKALQYKMGALCESRKVPLSLVDAIGDAADIPVQAVDGLFGLVRKPQDFSDVVGGPATMISATAAATKIGIWAIMELAGLLSISVGILNLLPAPPLDGGQMAMAVAEMLRGGRRLSIRAQAIAGGIGLTFVAALIFAAMAVDFKRFLTPDKPNVPPPAKAAPAPTK